MHSLRHGPVFKALTSHTIWGRVGSLALAVSLLAPNVALAANPSKPAPVVAAAPAGAKQPEVWPMKWDLAVAVGYDGFSKNTGLGNAGTDKAGNRLGIPGDAAAVGVRVTSWFMGDLGAELEGKFVSTDILTSGQPAGHAYVYGVRAMAIYQFLEDDSPVRLFVNAGGGMDMFKSKETTAVLQAKNVFVKSTLDADPALMLGGGLKWQALHDISLRVDLRLVSTTGLTGHKTTANFEGFLGIAYTLGGKPGDDDGDGILNPYDKCPDQAEDKDAFEDDDGCPELDNDKDGVADLEDKCPNDPEDKDGFEDYDGCPELDNDKDGVLDDKDKCPTQAEDKDGYKDDDGCPDPDNDGDGILDANDKCPNEAEDKDGYQDEDGCPDPDNDKDGVMDKADKCPNQGETRNGFQDDDGCPDEVPADLLAVVGKPLAGVAFTADNGVDEKKEVASLKAAAAVLIKHMAKVIVKVSSPSADKATAQARADAIKVWLVANGVKAETIEAQGESTMAPPPPPDPAAKPVKGKPKAAPVVPDVVTITLKV